MTVQWFCLITTWTTAEALALTYLQREDMLPVLGRHCQTLRLATFARYSLRFDVSVRILTGTIPIEDFR